MALKVLQTVLYVPSSLDSGVHLVDSVLMLPVEGDKALLPETSSSFGHNLALTVLYGPNASSGTDLVNGVLMLPGEVLARAREEGLREEEARHPVRRL